jgi:hypothetical protein
MLRQRPRGEGIRVSTVGRRHTCWYVRAVRTTFEFDFVTTATPDQVVELMTDFSPNRPHRWPASSICAAGWS